jgi:hypothetical protein
VSELRKKYALETSHIKSAAELAKDAAKQKRAKSDSEWSAYLARMRKALNDPSVPEGIESMHKALRAAPALKQRRDSVMEVKGKEGYREEARERVHTAVAPKVEARRKYLMLLKEEAASWVTEANLREKIMAAIDCPVDYGSHLDKVLEREREVAKKLQELRLDGPILPSDTEITPINIR